MVEVENEDDGEAKLNAEEAVAIEHLNINKTYKKIHI